jgi:4-alpha-glucanotransferase
MYHLQSKANFKKAENLRNILFKIAWQNFKSNSSEEDLKAFNNFCFSEKEWLDDFTLYTVLKKQLKNKPWYEWPNEFKQRDSVTLSKLFSKKADEINYHKWLQYVFLNNGTI